MDIEAKRMVFLSKNKKSVIASLSGEPKMIYNICRETKILLPNLSRTLKELEGVGIIHQRNVGVRRGKIFELTEKGRVLYKEMVNHF